MPGKYQKQVSDFLVGTKAKAIVMVVFDGAEGNLFEVRAIDEKYMRKIPGALIEVASRIEKDLNAADLARKKAKLEQEEPKRARKSVR